jgi:hypothetical protein
MPAVTDTNVIQLQAAISQQWDALQACFDAGQLAGKAPSGGALSSGAAGLNQRVLAFLAMTPSFWNAGAQMDQGEALQRDLNSFTDALTSSGFANVPGKASVAAPAELFGSLQGLGVIVLLIMVMNAVGKR